MDRNGLICGCFHARTSASMLLLAQDHQDMFTPLAQEPLCLAQSPDPSTCSSSFLAMSRLSKTQVSRVGLNDLLANRRPHAVFQELSEEEERSNRVWLWVGEAGGFEGPLSAPEMDALFHQGKINEKTLIKRKFEEESVPFNKLLMRYYKRKCAVWGAEAGEGPAVLSKKVAGFKKGELPVKKSWQLEKFKGMARPEKMNFTAVAPSVMRLGFFSGDNDSEEGEPVRITRSRAQTLFA